MRLTLDGGKKTLDGKTWNEMTWDEIFWDEMTWVGYTWDEQTVYRAIRTVLKSLQIVYVVFDAYSMWLRCMSMTQNRISSNTNYKQTDKVLHG